MTAGKCDEELDGESEMTESDWLAEKFQEKRSHLRAVACRILGSNGEADDAVQEASRAPRSTVLRISAVGSRPWWPGSAWTCFGRAKPEKKNRLRNDNWK